MDHHSALYVGLPLHLTQKLVLVQNAAAQLLTGVRPCQHIIPALRNLHCLLIGH